ncbi:MAG: T9SS type A sorting domain-containing protein [Bacteroidetes bacterium]|nr:T9SS type A sorting domain-containing protein [Bacteroidota bacterium]
MKKIFIIIFSLAAASVFSQQGWFYLNPTPTGNAIIDIKMVNENSGISVTSSEILRTTNGGVNWSRVYMPWVLKNICLYMVDSATGYIALDSGKIVKTTNGGVNWYFISSITGANIAKMFFQNPTRGFIIASGKIFLTTNGGENWEEKYSSYDCSFSDIYFVASTGYAVADQYQFIHQSIYKTKIFKTENNGLTWDSIPNSLYLKDNSVFFANSNTGHICGRTSIYNTNVQLMKTTDRGMNWFIAQNFGGIGQLYFAGNDTGYAVYNNTFLKTYNGGLNWTFSNINNLNGASVYKISVINNQKILAAGGTGEIVKTENAGFSWINYTKSTINVNFNEVMFCDKNTGYISGYDGKLYRTTNGCISFDTLKPSLPYSWYFYTMSVVNKNVIYGATDNNVYKTTNGGVNWSVSHPSSTGLNLLKIKFINENTGFGVSKRNIFVKTTNGGDSWSTQNILSYEENWSVDFYNENIGIAGGVMLVRTSNGGITWDTLRTVHSGTFIKYINRDIIFIVSIGGINKSTDGGNTWKFTPLPGPQVTYSYIEFPNEKTGYINSFNAMYKTTNQGENWFQINRGGETFSFSMIDSVNGYSVGRYREILKTTDGGGTLSSIPNFPAYVPDNFYLYQNYPNPFNPTTKIKFDLPKDGNVKIIIFDILGREIEKLTDEKFAAGVHEVLWNASRYSAGVYFYMLLTDNIKETRKMILIK